MFWHMFALYNNRNEKMVFEKCNKKESTTVIKKLNTKF
jgi:hypothetical protein